MEKGYSDFVCKILGDGPLREELHSLTLRLGLGENIRFLGALPQHRVFENLRECDLFVLPCVVAGNGDMDGIPVSIMEAMALKKPVVSTSISGIPELVKDGAGILVPPGDSSSLAQAILRIMKLDPEERALMGEKGYEIVQREFNLRENVERIKELFLNQY
jgi:glycosyltransferase involved in cell wall biosynthesis